MAEVSPVTTARPIFRRDYYPPNTPRESDPKCGASVGVMDQWFPGGCKLSPFHDGAHDASGNWRAHVEVSSGVAGVEIEFRSWHDSRVLTVRSQAEADALLKFLAESFDEAFGGAS